MEELHGDFYKFESVSGHPLANLRSKMAEYMVPYRKLMRQIAEKGCAIGVSPRDDVLENKTKEQLRDTLIKILCNSSAQGSASGLQSRSAPALLLIGEYSNKHRWHYHGAIIMDTIEELDKVKKKIRRSIGRVITEQIGHVENYVNYCFKSYTEKPTNLLQKWHLWDTNSFITTINPLGAPDPSEIFINKGQGLPPMVGANVCAGIPPLSRANRRMAVLPEAEVKFREHRPITKATTVKKKTKKHLITDYMDYTFNEDT